MAAFANPYAPVMTEVSLPYSNPIPGGLSNDKQIQIQGIVQDHPGVSGFAINLCQGPKIDPNTHLHFNPRFFEGCIVRNAMQHGGWGQEERDGGMPLKKGELFEIIIMCSPSGYLVAVNGRHFTEFKHRMPMSDAKYLVISGDKMKINFIKYEGGSMADAGPMAYAAGPPGVGFIPAVAPPPYNPGGFTQPHFPPAYETSGSTLYNPPVPLTQRIPGKLSPMRMIYISGTPSPTAKRFTFNLQSGSSSSPTIQFHFDVRVAYMGEKNVVVRNTLVNGGWGTEERSSPPFPFTPNAPFDMIIMADSDKFKVAVNNSHYIAYKYRLPVENSDTLHITGDVKITSVRFQ